MTMYTNKVITAVDDSTTEDTSVKLSVEELREAFELVRCVEWITKNEVKKVCLQFPDNLLRFSADIASCLEEHLGFRLYILGDGTYGSCCVDEVASQHIGADAIIHFGHYCLSPTVRLPVLYIFEKKPLDVASFVSSFKARFPEFSSRILLLYDVAYKHAVGAVSYQLGSIYPSLVVSRLLVDEPIQEDRQSILGRTFTLKDGTELETYEVVFLGPEGHSLETLMHALPGCRFHIFNPAIHKSIEDYQPDRGKFHRRRMYLIEKVKQAQTLGILIGTLTVARYHDAVNRIKSLAKKMGKKCYIIAVGKPNVAKLANFPEIEVYVLVACPESSLLDSKEFFQPVVTMHEVELALNSEHTWSEKHITDFRTLLPGGSDYVPEKEGSGDTETSNVSLIDGQLHHFQQSDAEPEQSSAVSLRADTTVSMYGGFGLSSRSWTGLEQKLGQTEVEKAVLGRRGIAQHYTHEQGTDQ